jgi:hypothetical protein
MLKNNLCLLLSLFFLLLIGGCATTTNYELRALETKVLKFETELIDKDSQIADLNRALKKERQEKEVLLKILEKRKKTSRHLTSAITEQKKQKASSKPYYSSIIKIQTALKNSGFNPGSIDGKLGVRTHAAIMKFQKANGLPADGWLDKQVWVLLRNYL